MRVLCVLCRDPFAQRDGATFAVRASLERLAARAELTLTGFDSAFGASRLGGHACAGALDEPANRAASFLAALARGRAYSLEKYASPAAVARLQALLVPGRFEVVWYEQTQAAGVAWGARVLGGRGGGPLHVLRSHNVEYALVAQTRGQGRPLAGPLLRLEASRLRRAELGLVAAMDRVLTVTAEDAETYRVALPGLDPWLRHAPVPAEVAEGGAAVPWPGRRTVVFLGHCLWGPNAEAARWICQALAPALAASCPDLRIRLVGAGTEAFQAGSPANVSCAGFVDDLGAELDAALCTLAPVRGGGGVNVKVLESLARGLPVVGARFARRGVDSEAFLEAETPGEFVVRLRELRSAGRGEALAALARRDAVRARVRFDAVLDEALRPAPARGGGA